MCNEDHLCPKLTKLLNKHAEEEKCIYCGKTTKGSWFGYNCVDCELNDKDIKTTIKTHTIT